jgi:RNA polymerase sigma-70 factor (ECF subfamily)
MSDKNKSSSQSAEDRAASAQTRGEDADLMARVASNDQQAIAELYDRFVALVFRMAYQALPTRPEAEDAVQEVFLRLWRTADRFDSERAALVTWVMLITRRHIVDRLRRTRSRISTVSMGEGPGSSAPVEESTLEQTERFGALLKRVDSLPELQRTVVMRSYLGGQTLRQISEELDTPLGTVKSALSRALVRLRERVGEEVVE